MPSAKVSDATGRKSPRDDREKATQQVRISPELHSYLKTLANVAGLDISATISGVLDGSVTLEQIAIARKQEDQNIATRARAVKAQRPKG